VTVRTEACAACRERFPLSEMRPSRLIRGSWMCKDLRKCEDRIFKRIAKIRGKT